MQTVELSFIKVLIFNHATSNNYIHHTPFPSTYEVADLPILNLLFLSFLFSLCDLAFSSSSTNTTLSCFCHFQIVTLFFLFLFPSLLLYHLRPDVSAVALTFWFSRTHYICECINFCVCIQGSQM
jgi:hypothetical protein